MITYFDNIIVYSKILNNYQLFNSIVLKSLEARDLYLKLEKYKIYKKEVNFLGFIIRRNRLYIDLKKFQIKKE